MMALFKCFWSLQSPRLFFFRAKSHLASPVATRYEAIIRGEQEVPEHFNFASDVVDKWIQLEKGGKRPQNPAFWWVNNQKEEVKWSFEELGILSQKAANVLTGPCGLQRGDRIMTVLPRIPEWWILIMACMRAGIVFIPGISQLTAKDISYRLQVSKAKCIVVSEMSAPAVESITSECKFLQNKILVSESSRDGWLNFKELLQAAPVDHTCVKTKSLEPMAIYFTSGTTGTPKMVEQSHSSYAIGLTASGRHLMALHPSAIMWNTSDTGWIKTSWSCAFAPWMHGSCVFVHHLPQFEPTVVLNTLASYPINIFCTPPTGFRMLIQHDLTSYKFMSLEHCVTGGEPLNPEVFEQWKTQTGLDIYEGYGQTETVGICTNVLGMKIKPGSMGKPSPPYDVQIVDDQGNILPPGEEGDIGLRIKPKRPFCLFSKYIDDPEKTAASERGDFYVTGDRGTKDEEGYFWFVGRSDDVINSAGYRIGPFEVESALLEHPAVVESAVVSSPDPVRGEVVKAFVILSPEFLSHDPEKLTKELQDHVKKVTAPYKYPRKVEFVQDLPKTVVGKIQRSVLRNREWGSGQHGAFLLVSDTPSSSSRFGPERLRKDVGTWKKIAKDRLKSIRTSEEAVPPEVFSRSYRSSSLTTTSCRVPWCKTAGWLQKDGHGTEISEAFLTNTEARSNFSAMKTLLKLQILKSFWIPGQPQRSFHRHHRVLSSPIFAQYEAVSRGEQQLPEYFNFASDVLDKWSQMEKDGKRASNPALWWINGRGGEVRWDFEELGILSKKVANILSDHCGLRRGDRIMVILPRIPEWWLLTVACIRTGIIIIPGISQLRAKDIEYRLQASKAKCIITTDALAPVVDSIADGCGFLQTKMMVSSEEGKRDGWLSFNELFKEAPADHTCAKTKLQDPMMIYFTSGTTGPPKMTELSQGSFGFRSILNKRCWLDLTPSDVMWCTVDTGWVVAALGSVFDPWILGTCAFVHNLPQAEPTTIPNTLSRFPITTFLAVPTIFRMLVKSDLASYKFMSLKYCMSAGEPLNPEVMEQWKKKTGLDIHEVYGQTETGLICCVRKGMKVIPGSMGKACPPYDVQIIDEETNILPPGQEGAIAIRVKPQRPLGLFSRYVDNPEKTAAAERGDFYVTGDRGTMDKEGYIWFIGREDDIIKSSGYRIGPFEVENALIEHPAVAEVAAVSSPDPLRKEVVKAFVVLSPDYTLKNKEILTLELQEHVKKVTAPYKYPRKIEFVQELPKTATGKIKRNELRDREWGRI